MTLLGLVEACDESLGKASMKKESSDKPWLNCGGFTDCPWISNTDEVEEGGGRISLRREKLKDGSFSLTGLRMVEGPAGQCLFAGLSELDGFLVPIWEV